MTVAENITKSANRRAKKLNLTEEEDLGGSSFHSASKNRPKLGKSHSSTSPAAMLLSIPQTSSASLLQPLAVTPKSRGTTLDPIVLFPGHNFIRDVKAKDDTNPSLELVGDMIGTLDLNDKTDMDWLSQSLWSLFACMAFDSVASTMARTNSWDAYLLHVAKFEQICTNLRLLTHHKTKLLDNLPDGDIPAEVIDFFSEIRDTMPSKRFIKDSKTHTNDPLTVKLAYFGNRIWNRSDEVRKIINGQINPLWVHLTKSKSGAGNNMNAIIEGIRACTWPMEVISRAQTNTKTAISRIKNESKKKLPSASSSTSSTSTAAFIASFSSGENVTQDSQDPPPTLKKRSGLGASSIGMEGSNDEVGDGVAVEDLDAPEDIDLPGFKTLYPAQFRNVFAK